MKKTFLILFLSAIGSTAFAQQLPDGGFEDWKTETPSESGKEEYKDLANPFWTTLNMLYSLPPVMGIAPITVTQDQGRTGVCPKMVSKNMTLGNDTIFLPGVVGAFNVIIEKMTARFGKPYVYRPKALEGYLKYSPVNGDSARVFIELYKFDNNRRRTIGRGTVTFTGEVKEWTKFNLDVEYVNDGTPDSACVFFVASAGYNFDSLTKCKGQVGSTLWVDDCAFIFDGTPNESEILKQQKIVCYPNPARDVLYFQCNLMGQEAVLQIFDPMGRMVKTQAVISEKTEIDIQDLNAGMYSFRLLLNGTQAAGNGKFVVTR